ncbi:hypothetical protein ABZW10_38695, partial [Kitasatospora sp. NPDC004723]|uniref:hypothetical protein n=1 Tax=Kitasatospora sp. NPDC004723 TaxID=3154288 RepID=UPI0033B700DA
MLRDALEQAHGENLDLRRELARRAEKPHPHKPESSDLLSASHRSKEQPELRQHAQIAIEPATTEGGRDFFFRVTERFDGRPEQDRSGNRRSAGYGRGSRVMCGDSARRKSGASKTFP